MGANASQITSVTIVYSTVYSGADQSKHQGYMSLAFVWGIHHWPVNSPHKWPVTRKMFPFDDVIMKTRIFMVFDHAVSECRVVLHDKTVNPYGHYPEIPFYLGFFLANGNKKAHQLIKIEENYSLISIYIHCYQFEHTKLRSCLQSAIAENNEATGPYGQPVDLQ